MDEYSGEQRNNLHLKKLDSKPNSRDVFNDKTSISMFDEVLNLSQNKIKNYAKFFNDVLFDQNACTSPKIIIWIDNKI